jgi:DNA-binding GntR family transcriptional regulator
MINKGLQVERQQLQRRSMAVEVANILRARVSEGHFPPGSRLAEDQICGELGISRNTLREGFRLLTSERLVEHLLNRGVYVRVPNVNDVADIYRVRRYIECSAVRHLTAPPRNLDRIAAAVDQGQRALDDDDGQGIGTANIAFHQEIVAIANSSRVDEFMRRILAELRLVFHVMDNLWFHLPYLARNRDLHGVLEKGGGIEAAELLESYLLDAERQILDVYANRRSRHLL